MSEISEIPETEAEKALFTDPPQPDEKVEVVDEVTRLQREAKAAAERVSLLRNRQRDALREHERLGEDIKQAEAAADETMSRYRAVVPAPKLPPVPTHAECLAMARAQRPDAPDHETVKLAAALHATMSDGRALAGSGMIHGKPAEITGSEVRDTQDTHYNIEPIPPDAPPGRYIKRYGI
jgi:hypothetical protein